LEESSKEVENQNQAMKQWKQRAEFIQGMQKVFFAKGFVGIILLRMLLKGIKSPSLCQKC